MSNQSINEVDNTEVTVGHIKFNRNELIGQGGYGQVYRGEYNGIKVAVKRVLFTRGESYLIEEEALKKLDHPNVIKLFYCVSDPNFRYYAVELCACSIMDKLFLPHENPEMYKGPSLPPPEDVLIQMFRGLNYIHVDARLVHRDIKPGNVLISLPIPQPSGKPVIKWADFGLSKALKGSKMSYTPSGFYRGTYHWMAPEIYKAGRDQDPKYRGTIKSDIFSAACVAFYFLTEGSHPFGPLVDDVAVSNNVMANKPIFLEKLEFGHFARYVIVKMLAHLPQDRMPLEEAIQDLEIPTSDDGIDKQIMGIENRYVRRLTAENLANRIYHQMFCDHPDYYWMVVVYPAENDSVVVYSETRNPQKSFIHQYTCGGRFNVVVFRTDQLPQNIPDKDSPSFITTVKEVFYEAQKSHNTTAEVLDEAKRNHRLIEEYHQIVVKIDQPVDWKAEEFSFFKETVGSYYVFLIEVP